MGACKWCQQVLPMDARWYPCCSPECYLKMAKDGFNKSPEMQDAFWKAVFSAARDKDWEEEE